MASTITQSSTSGTSLFFHALLSVALLANLAFVINPLIIEGIIIGDQGLPLSELDRWIANTYIAASIGESTCPYSSDYTPQALPRACS
jgi:hypothetical protein